MPQTRSPCARLSRAHRNTAGSAPALPPIRPRAGNTRTPSLHETDEDAGRLCAIPPLGVGNEEEQQSLVAPVSFYVHTVESDHAQDDRPSVLRLPPGGGSCYPVFLVLRQAPLLQDLPRGRVAPRREPSYPVVADLHVFDAPRRHCGACGIAPLMDPLVFDTGAPTLDGGAIPIIPVAALRAAHAVGRQFVLNGVSSVRATPTRMMPQSPCWFPAEPRPRQRVRHDVRRHAGFQ